MFEQGFSSPWEDNYQVADYGLSLDMVDSHLEPSSFPSDRLLHLRWSLDQQLGRQWHTFGRENRFWSLLLNLGMTLRRHLLESLPRRVSSRPFSFSWIIPCDRPSN